MIVVTNPNIFVMEPVNSPYSPSDTNANEASCQPALNYFTTAVSCDESDCNSDSAQVVNATWRSTNHVINGEDKQLNDSVQTTTTTNCGPSRCINLADYLNNLASQPKFEQSPLSQRFGKLQKCSPSMLLASDSRRSPSTPGLASISREDNVDGEGAQTAVCLERYLIKRRLFLLDRIVERYEQLLKLLHDELELIGTPSPNYLECVHAYREAHYAAKEAHAIYDSKFDTKPSGEKLAGTNTRKYSVVLKCPLPAMPKLGRLQPTGFMLSPRVIRRASMKISPSINSLLTASQSSLQIDLMDSLRPMRAGTQTYCHRSQPRSHSFAAEMSTLCPPPKPIVSHHQSTSNFQTDSLKPKLVTSRMRKSFSTSLSDLVKLPSNLRPRRDFWSKLHLSSYRDKSKSNRLKKTSRVDNDVDVDDDGGGGEFLEAVNDDPEQAVAWLEVELNAVRNILDANLKCADMNKRNRESYRAYRAAAKQNEQTIKTLECRLDVLKNVGSTAAHDSDMFANNQDTNTNSICSQSSSLSFDIRKHGVLMEHDRHLQEEQLSKSIDRLHSFVSLNEKSTGNAIAHENLQPTTKTSSPIDNALPSNANDNAKVSLNKFSLAADDACSQHDLSYDTGLGRSAALNSSDLNSSDSNNTELSRWSTISVDSTKFHGRMPFEEELGGPGAAATAFDRDQFFCGHRVEVHVNDVVKGLAVGHEDCSDEHEYDNFYVGPDPAAHSTNVSQLPLTYTNQIIVNIGDLNQTGLIEEN